MGFLYNEGLITSVDDVLDLHIGRAPEEVIRVELRDRDLSLPQRRTLTSGCGGGITFVDLAVARDAGSVLTAGHDQPDIKTDGSR